MHRGAPYFAHCSVASIVVTALGPACRGRCPCCTGQRLRGWSCLLWVGSAERRRRLLEREAQETSCFVSFLRPCTSNQSKPAKDAEPQSQTTLRHHRRTQTSPRTCASQRTSSHTHAPTNPRTHANHGRCTVAPSRRPRFRICRICSAYSPVSATSRIPALSIFANPPSIPPSVPCPSHASTPAAAPEPWCRSSSHPPPRALLI